MAFEVIMPRLAADMEEGTVSTWLKASGEQVEKGASLFEVESEKANLEVEAPATGVLTILVSQGSSVTCGTVIGVIAARDEVVAAGSPQAPSNGNGQASQPVGGGTLPVATTEQKAPNRATPAARRVARELNVDLEVLSGTGPGGRIVEQDVRAFAESRAAAAARPAAPAPVATPIGSGGAAPSAAAAAEWESVALSRLRRVTGERMVESVHSAPHFVLSVDVDMSEAGRLRDRWQHPDRPNGGKVSYTTLLIRAVGQVLKRHPMVNGTFHQGELRLLRDINVGVAMAVKEGLIVPVIRSVDRKNLADLSDAVEDLRQRAESMKFRAEELSGGTFTISNLGMFGIDRFNAIINPPEAAILAVGQIAKRPVVVGDDIVARPMMTLTLSVDHRVLDGAGAAEFLRDLKRVLENPYLLV